MRGGNSAYWGVLPMSNEEGEGDGSDLRSRLRGVEDRALKNEGKIFSLATRCDTIEVSIRDNRQERLSEIKDLRLAIQHIANEQYHELDAKIEDVKNINSARVSAWGTREWVAVISAIILAATNIIIKVIEVYGGV